MRGVILYGPPASGKDTITAALGSIHSSYTLFPRFKVGTGKSTGYRMVSKAALAEMRAAGDIVWENRRYGSTYLVDRPSLLIYLVSRTPVVHLGQVDAVDAVARAVPDARWLRVHLWCPRGVAAQRIAARGDVDALERLSVWDETPALPNADLAIDTATVSADGAAREIHRHLKQLSA
jgi:guanylate kinase